VRAHFDACTSILCAPTPAGWVEDALSHLPDLLQDHANCEKKAASTALALMFAYPEDRALGAALSRLAREELRHFEQVIRTMTTLGLPFVRQRRDFQLSDGRISSRAHESVRDLLAN